MNKASIERDHIERFLAKQEIEHLALESVKKDPPDFLMTTKEGKKIAIEHTRLMVKDGGKIIAWYKAIEKTIELAQSLYEKKECPPIKVYFQFNSPLDTTKGNDKEIANELCELVCKNIPPLNDDDQYVEFSIPDNHLPYNASEMKIVRYKGLKKSLWQRRGFVWSGEMELEILEENVEKKHKILIEMNYKNLFDEAWLILIVEGKEWSEFATYVPRNFVPKDYWKFDRIYVSGLFANEMERII